MKETNSIIYIFFAFVIATFVLFSCEPDADQLGKQFLTDTAALDELNADIVAYNVDNNDEIRSDANVLESALLGVFYEKVFGKRKASYVTQLIPDDFSRDFGKNTNVDSVILQIIPRYKRDSVVTSTTKIDKDSTNDVGYIKTVNTYPLNIYGKRKIGNEATKLTIKVSEINEFIGSSDSEIQSKREDITDLKFLGKTTISTKVESEIRTSINNPNEELLNKAAAIHIGLDSNYFKTKIVDKQGQSEMSDVASFVRYFKGIRISVEENNGFLFYFNPNDISLKMYYSYDKTESNQTITRQKRTLTFNLGSVNARFSQFEFERPSEYKTAMQGINTSKGDAKLYLQGSGGAGAEFVIPDVTIQKLRDGYLNNKTGILSAKIVLHSDAITWKENFEKPSNFTVLQKGTEQFMEDMTVLRRLGLSQVNAKNLDKNPAQYDLDITQTLKNIVEKNYDNKPITINVGTFAVDNKGMLKGWDNTTRAYTPNRVVLVGSDPTNDKRAQLKIIYAKK